MGRRLFRISVFLLLTGILALGIVLIWTSYHTSKTIHELLGDNRELPEAIRNLTGQTPHWLCEGARAAAG